MKSIRFSGHASEQLPRRGVAEAEVVAAIEGAPWHVGDRGRLECRMDFPFRGLWNGKPYTTKQVRPIFVEEETEIVVVTVYSYYF